MIIEKRIPLSYWFNLIKWDMLTVTFFIFAIHYINKYVPDLKIPLPVGTFLGTAIALLLSFKLSHSYDRWWEARKIWGSIVNDSRTLVIQLKSFVGAGAKEKVNIIALRQIAWCYALSNALRNLDLPENIIGLVSSDDLNSLEGQSNIPLTLIDQHSEDIMHLHKDKEINDFQQIQLDSTLLRLVESMGRAERIKNTPFPKTYRMTLHFFIYVFIITMSFSLTEMEDRAEIILLLLISLPFFLLEKISQSIQDPFENKPMDTAMNSISSNIENNIKDLMGVPSSVAVNNDDHFYHL
jgi:putative membrane protein